MNIKAFGEATIIYSIGNCGLRAASFLLLPLYTHFLSIHDYGMLSILQTTIAIMIILMDFGVRDTFVRFLPDYEKNQSTGTLLGTASLVIFIGGLFVSLIAMTLFVPIFINIVHVNKVGALLIIACFMAVIQAFFSLYVSFFRAKKLAKIFMYYSLVVAVTTMFLSFLFLVFFHLGIMGAILAQIISYGAIFIIVNAFDILPRLKFKISPELLFRLPGSGFPLMIAGISWFLMDSSPLYLLSYFSNLQNVAIYSLGQKIAAIINIVFLLPFQLSFGPYIFGVENTDALAQTAKKLFTYFLLICFLAFTVIGFFAFLIIPLIAPPAYATSYYVAIGLMPSLTFLGIFIFGQLLLQNILKNHVIGIASGVGAIINIIMNIALIPRYGWHGIIAANTISYASTAVIVLFVAIKTYVIRLEWKKISIIFLLYIFLIVVFIMQAKYKLNIGESLLLAVLAISLSFFTLRFFRVVTKNDISRLFDIVSRLNIR